MLVEETRECSKCSIPKDIDEFVRNGNGRKSYCKLCHAQHEQGKRDADPQVYTQRARDWRAANPNRVKQNRLNKYNLTCEQYDLMLIKQDNRCAICTVLFTGRICIDHDHACCPETTSCGKCVRGLLCDPCNVAIGKLNDSVIVLARAIDYLRGEY